MKILTPTRWADMLRPEIARRGLAVELVPYDNGTTGPFPGAEVLFRADGHWQRVLDAAPDVKWLHTISAGVDHLAPAARRRGLLLTESGQAYRVCIGEFVLAQMLLAVKRFHVHAGRQREHLWEGLQHEELFGRTVGIVGLGPIGLGVAERARAFGMRVLGMRRCPEPADGVDEVFGPDALADFLAGSDFVVLACPLTEQTRGLINAAALARMKPSAWLFNIARGSIVDTDALVAALRENRLGGACLDVTDPEPLPPGHPLWDMPNVFLTPHNASGETDASILRKLHWFLDNVQRYLAGEPLLGLVQYHRGY